MTFAESLTIAGVAVAVLASICGFLAWLVRKGWQGGKMEQRLTDMGTVAAQIKETVKLEMEHVRETIGGELAHIAREVMLLRQSKDAQAEALTRTVTMVDKLEKRMDRWEDAHPAP